MIFFALCAYLQWQSLSPNQQSDDVQYCRGYVTGYVIEQILVLKGTTHHEFLSCLINSKVTLLTNAVNPKQSQIGEPLCVPNKDNKPLMALFSSPERGKSLQELHPSFRYAVEVRFQDALRLMAGKTGMALNLGWNLSLQMPPEGIVELARDISSKN